MRKIFGLLLILVSSFSFGQRPEPADFSTSVSKTDVTIGDVIEVTFKAPIQEKLHIYAFGGNCEVGPKQPWYDKNPQVSDCELVGSLYNGAKPHTAFDDIFNCDVAQFEGDAVIKQKIRITGKNPTYIGELWYQICSESMCLDYGYEFSLPNLNVNDKPADTTEPVPTSEDPVEDTTTASEIDESDTSRSADTSSSAGNTEVEVEDENKGQVSGADDKKSKGLWALFLLGVLGGIPAIFTPCVYPMIPMTVAFFTKETDKAKGKKKAIFYGLSIIAIYLILGVALSLIFGKTFPYTLSTHWFPNILFFTIFIIFALSFFGWFELTLPASFVNKIDSKGDKGGYIGVFFVAFTLVLVSFSCTAPIVGTVAFLATDGEIVKSLAAMLGFSLVFALPFGLFAFFPQWLNNLPQSGGWLNSVKVVLGFVELALAFKFLSQADLAYHWGILDRDVFLSIWIICALLLGAYLLGKIKLPHDSDLPRIPVPRFMMGIAALIFGLYMIPGLWGAPLKPLAGFIPPMSTQDFVGSHGGESSHGSKKNTHKYADVIKTATHLDVNPYFDYDEAIEASKKEKKPVFVDFTGHTCANCRKMEEYVWPESSVLTQLQNDYIVLSLYCDESHVLPESDWYTNADGDVLKTIGAQNLDRQDVQFGSLGQPYYYVIDWEENQYGVFEGYDPDYKKFEKFLRDGKEDFDAWLKK